MCAPFIVEGFIFWLERSLMNKPFFMTERVMSQNVNSHPRSSVVSSYVDSMCELVSMDNVSLESWSGYIERVEV